MTSALPFIFCVGANHNSAKIELRERLYLSKEAIAGCLPLIKKRFGVDEGFILSTCNRLEFYGVCNSRRIELADIQQLFVDIQAEGHDQNIDPVTITDSLYVHTGEKAINHVFSVTSGLDSLVIGETQITGQIKDAVEFCRQQGSLGPILTRMEQEALKTAKKVRTYTDIGKKTVSISHAAVDLCLRLTGGFEEKHIVVIGAGEMGRIAGLYLKNYPHAKLSICNRSMDRAKELGELLGAQDIYTFEQMESALADADVVISSTAKDGFILDHKTLQRWQQQREYRTLYLVDIALPRDIDPDCGKIDDVYLFDIDDLKQIVNENLKERKSAAEKAKGIVIDSTLGFSKWVGSLNISALVAEFKRYLDTLVVSETNKTLRKKSWGSLGAEQRADLDRLTSSISGKILRDVVLALKNPPAGHLQEQMASALKAMFALELSVQDESAQVKSVQDESLENDTTAPPPSPILKEQHGKKAQTR